MAYGITKDGRLKLRSRGIASGLYLVNDRYYVVRVQPRMHCGDLPPVEWRWVDRESFLPADMTQNVPVAVMATRQVKGGLWRFTKREAMADLDLHLKHSSTICLTFGPSTPILST